MSTTCVQRATHVDPYFAYAYTLAGHECVPAGDDPEKALACYRNAVRLDPRHYNAWYGLGMLYFRQEKFTLAEHHFRRALEVNAHSSTLHFYVGLAVMLAGMRVGSASWAIVGSSTSWALSFCSELARAAASTI